jgi:predicted nuclease with TOPRIM domain
MSKNSRKTKAPQIFTTVLLVACPIALAEQAQAQTTSLTSLGKQSAFQPYSGGLLGEQPLLAPQRTGISNPFQRQLGMNPNQSLAQFPYFSSLPFVKTSTQEEYQNKVAEATATLNSAKKALSNAQNHLNSLTANKNKAQNALDVAKTAFDSATDRLDSLKANTDSNSDSVDDAKSALDTATNNLTSAEQVLQSADDAVNRQMSILQSAHDALNTAHANLTTASSNLQSAQTAHNLASENLTSKSSALQSAQSAYNSSQVPNPNYVPPQPSYRTDTITNLLFNSDFSRGIEGWSGVATGWQGSQPGLFNGQIVFSYMNQTVSQGLYSGPFNNATLTLSADWYNNDSNRNITDSYSMTVSAQDINHNPVGSATYTSQGRHDWENKSVTLVASGPVSWITVSFSGIDNGYWYGDYGPHLRNPQLQVSSQTPTQSTSAPSIATGTMNVDINEGGEATFTAPNNGAFISSNLRYEAYDDATCGANVSPQLGGNTVTLSADNGTWGDPCGGWVKHLVGTLTYSSAEPEFIKDPALYTALQTAQSNYDSAQSAYDTAQSSLQQAQDAQSSAQSSVDDSNSYVTELQTGLLNSQSSKDSAVSTVNNLKSIRDAAQSAYEAEQTKFRDSQVEFSKAQTAYETSQSQYQIAQDNFANLEIEFNSASIDVEKATNDVEDAQQALDSIPQPEPEPEPEPEKPVAPEIPKGDPKDFTEAQVEELVNKAEAVLETAEQGSPAYEQALEALAVAAEADDPQISEALAAVPLLGDVAGAALEVLNNLGNVGADMAPAVREEAEKTVIASVIATGAAVNAVQAATQAAAGAVASATTSTSGSTSGGGGGGASGSSDSKPTRKTATSTRKSK